MSSVLFLNIACLILLNSIFTGTMVNNDLIPTDDVFKTMIGLDDGSGQRVTDMLLKMSSYSWIPSALVVEQLKDWFERSAQGQVDIL